MKWASNVLEHLENIDEYQPTITSRHIPIPACHSHSTIVTQDVFNWQIFPKSSSQYLKLMQDYCYNKEMYITLPMPHLVSISAVTLPTPPTPTTATAKVRIFYNNKQMLIISNFFVSFDKIIKTVFCKKHSNPPHNLSQFPFFSMPWDD